MFISTLTTCTPYTPPPPPKRTVSLFFCRICWAVFWNGWKKSILRFFSFWDMSIFDHLDTPYNIFLDTLQRILRNFFFLVRNFEKKKNLKKKIWPFFVSFVYCSLGQSRLFDNCNLMQYNMSKLFNENYLYFLWLTIF